VSEQTVQRSEWTGGSVVGRMAAGDWLPASRHHHAVPGVWDSDNGDAAGKLCTTCWVANRPCALTAVEAGVVRAQELGR